MACRGVIYSHSTGNLTLTLSPDNTSFVVYEGPQLEFSGVLGASSTYMDLGQNSTLAGAYATGGSGNYTYQWLEQVSLPPFKVFQNTTNGCLSGQDTNEPICKNRAY